MRIWSLDPAYLDARGLVALWREGLLALSVLEGKTKGYSRHPQLRRFLEEKDPVNAINCYLWFVYLESEARGYHFNREKIRNRSTCNLLQVTTGQLRYEMGHLKGKLNIRDPQKYKAIEKVRVPRPHPLFVKVSGRIEEWEKIK